VNKPRMIRSYGDPMALALKVDAAVRRWQIQYNLVFPGTIVLSVYDARWLDEQSSKRGDYIIKSCVKPGDKFTILGRPAVCEDIDTGTAYMVFEKDGTK